MPIWIAALGDANVALTAEIANGWLPILFAPEHAGSIWGDALAKGTAKRSADLGPLEISAGGLVAIGEDVKPMLDFMRPFVALYVGGMGAKGKNFYNTLVSSYGFEAEAAEIQELYLAGKKKEAEERVPLDLLEMLNLVGPESYVKERIAAFREAGVTDLQVIPVDQDPASVISRLKEWTA